MWSPVQLEHLTLATPLSCDECVARLAHTTAPALLLVASVDRPVRGFVRARRFYLGRFAAAPIPLRTQIIGRLSEGQDGTRIDVAIGPNLASGVVLLLVGAMLAGAAVVATYLALVTSAWSGVLLPWAVVLGFGVVFFVLPAAEHGRDRAFLLDHLRTTIDARPRARAAARD